MSDAIDRMRSRIRGRLTEPDRLRFPSGWTLSTSWQRAQAADAVVGPATPVEWDVLLGSGDCHRVEFFIYGGDLRAGCDCDGWQFHDWCAHVALLWWRWVRADLVVPDLDTGRNHLRPPAWLRVDDADAPEPTSPAATSPDTARADGGPRTHAESARARESSPAPHGGCNTHCDSVGESHEGGRNTERSQNNTGHNNE